MSETQQSGGSGGIIGGRHYLRKCSLVVADAAGAGTELSELRTIFDVRAFDFQSPNTAVITVYNLSPDIGKKLQKEGTRVILKAGYESADYGIIFSGQIKQFRTGRVDPTTTFFEIRAQDGDVAYNVSTINVTLAAGSTAEDALAAVLDALKPYNVTRGFIGTLPPDRSIRAQVFSGMTRDVLRDLSQTWGMTWSIQGGKLTILPLTGRALPGDAIVLTSASGLIGRPEQTIDGIKARALLNPELVAGRTVRIDNTSITRGQYNLAYLGDLQNEMLNQVRVTEDGIYRVISVDYTGDTRGQDWYADIICIALGDPISVGLGQRGRV